MPVVFVHCLPDLVAPEALAGETVVVIDVLRATTTVVHALAAGAREVIPCLEVDEARRFAQDREAGSIVLGGERGGLKIAGFDLGNSPTEYAPRVVAGRTIVFTTTNGTRALDRARQAERVLLGAFVNLSTVAVAVRAAARVHLVCAGTQDEITREDVLFAGALFERLPDATAGNDSAAIAHAAWRGIAGTEALTRERLAIELRATLGGRNLLSEGFPDDLVTAADIDRFSIVPEYDAETKCIRIA